MPHIIGALGSRMPLPTLRSCCAGCCIKTTPDRRAPKSTPPPVWEPTLKEPHKRRDPTFLLQRPRQGGVQKPWLVEFLCFCGFLAPSYSTTVTEHARWLNKDHLYSELLPESSLCREPLDLCPSGDALQGF